MLRSRMVARLQPVMDSVAVRAVLINCAPLPFNSKPWSALKARGWLMRYVAFLSRLKTIRKGPALALAASPAAFEIAASALAKAVSASVPGVRKFAMSKMASPAGGAVCARPALPRNGDAVRKEEASVNTRRRLRDVIAGSVGR